MHNFNDRRYPRRSCYKEDDVENWEEDEEDMPQGVTVGGDKDCGNGRGVIEDDPLDLFMSNIDKQLAEEQKCLKERSISNEANSEEIKEKVKPEYENFMEDESLCTFYEYLADRRQNEIETDAILYARKSDKDDENYNSDDEVYDVAEIIDEREREDSHLDVTEIICYDNANEKISYNKFSKHIKDVYKEHKDISALNLDELIKLRNENLNVFVAGVSVDRPIASFIHLQPSIPNCVLDRLSAMGIHMPTSIQSQAISCGLRGRDILARAHTGTGKTIAFLLPIITKLLYIFYSKQRNIKKKGNDCDDQEDEDASFYNVDYLNSLVNLNDISNTEEGAPYALVLCPTRELAFQIYKDFRSLTKKTPLRGCVLVGSMNKTTNVKDLKKGVEFVVGNVGRVIDLANKKFLKFSNFCFFVLDEADRMLSSGFEKQVRSIARHVSPDRQSYLFSATIPPNIEQLARDILKSPVRITVGLAGQSAENIDQRFVICNSDNMKQEWLNTNIRKLSHKGKILIFCNTQIRVMEVFGLLNRILETEETENNLDEATSSESNELSYSTSSPKSVKEKEKIKLGVLHGDLQQHDRLSILDKYTKNKINILVASDVASRGLHINDILYVINYEICNNIEIYLHRIGRTGRANHKGISITLLNKPADAKIAAHIIENLELSGKSATQQLMDLALLYGAFRAARLEGTKMQTKIEKNVKCSTFAGLGYNSANVLTSSSSSSGQHSHTTSNKKKKGKPVALFVRPSSEKNKAEGTGGGSRWDTSASSNIASWQGHINQMTAATQLTKSTVWLPSSGGGVVINPSDDLSSSSEDERNKKRWNSTTAVVNDKNLEKKKVLWGDATTNEYSGNNTSNFFLSSSEVVGVAADLTMQDKGVSGKKKRSRWGQ